MTRTYQIVDQTNGDDIWTCGEPPAKLCRYKLARLIDGKCENYPDGILIDGLMFADFKEACRVLDRMNEEDFSSYVPPDFRVAAWSKQRP